MSKRLRKGNNLPPLQKRIILCLAERGAQTINETKENDPGIHHYKSTNLAFHSLEEKGLIQKHGVKVYRNREYPQYWLTGKGLRAAFKNGANHELLRENIENVWGEHELTPLFFELIHAFGPRNVDKVFEIFEASEKGFRIVSLPVMSKKKAMKTLKILKKYPKYAKRVKESLLEISKIL